MDMLRRLLGPSSRRFGVALLGALACEGSNAWLGRMTGVLALEPLPAGAFLAGVLFGRFGTLGWFLGQLIYRLALFEGTLLNGLPGSQGLWSSEAMAQWVGVPISYTLISIVGATVFRLGGRLGRGLPDYRSYVALLVGAAAGGMATAFVVGTIFELSWRGFVVHTASNFVSVLLVAPLVLLLADRFLRPLMAPFPGEETLPERFPASLELHLRSDGRIPLAGRLAIMAAMILAATGIVVTLSHQVPEVGGWTFLGYLGIIVWAALGYGMRGGLFATSLAGIAYLTAQSYADRDFLPDDPDLYAVDLYADFVVFSLVAAVLGAGREVEVRLREQMRLRDRMGDLLQAAVNTDEAFRIIGDGIARILPGTRGALYVTREANFLATAVVWGTPRREDGLYTSNDCWALRRGQIHELRGDNTAARCQHVADETEAYLCIPMMAQGEALGVLHVVPPEGDERGGPGSDDAVRRPAQALARQIGLALGNLRLREVLHDLSIRDALTGLLNRRYLEEQMEVEVSRAARDTETLVILMIDIDHFKRYNDTWGHEAGDVVLREVAQFLVASCRRGDLVVRYGGEEFVIVYPRTPLEAATTRVDELRGQVSGLRPRHEGQTLAGVTLSIGVAAWPQHGKGWREVLALADAALYEAKKTRDRVVSAGDVHIVAPALTLSA